MEKRYPSTRFVLLQNAENIENGKSKKIILAAFVLGFILLSIPSTFILYKVFLSANIEEDYHSSNLISSDIATTTPLPSKIWLGDTKPEINPHVPELLCGDHQALIVPQNSLNDPQLNLEDVISYHLVLYYQQIINDHDPYTLKSIFHDFQKKLVSAKHPEDFSKFLKSLNSNKLNFYLSRDRTFNRYKFRYFFDLTEELSKWYDYLHNLNKYLSSYEQQKNRRVVVLTEKNFESFVNKTQSRFYPSHYKFSITQKKLLEVNKLITEWMRPSRIISNGSAITFYNRAILLSELKETINSSFENINVFASRTIYLDENLTLPGVNIAMIAPKWIFLRKVTINLSGRSGEMHEDAVKGQIGKPGRPGGNSGDFLGAGDMNERFLVVITNGGKGGKGQNGARGRDGINFTLPEYPHGKPNCTSKLNNFTNRFGELITLYKVFNPAGCGEPGTAGGTGGIGGKGGKVILLNRKIEIGLDGVQGPPGKGGAGGKGGIGCFYEILDVNDEVIHPITTVKCQNDTLPSGIAGADNYNIKGRLHPLQKGNLSVSDSLLNFLHLSGKDFVEFNDSIITLFFKKLNSYNSTDFIAKQFQVFKSLDQDEFYKIVESSIDQMSNNDQILKALVLGRRLILRKTNFLFIDLENYLETLRWNIKSIQNDLVYPVSLLQVKFDKKLMKIKDNLNLVKAGFERMDLDNKKSIMKSLKLENDHKYVEIASALQERRALYVVLAYVESIACFIAQLTFKKSCLSYIKSLKAAQLNREEFFRNIRNITSQQQLLLSEVLSINEFKDHPLTYLKAVEFLQDLGRKDEIFFENLSSNQLIDIKEGLSSCVEFLSTDGRILLEALTTQVDNFIGLYPIVEWHELEQKFRKSLTNLKFDGTQSRALQKELRDVMITLQYVSAVDATQLKLFPLKKLPRFLRDSNNTAEEALFQINNLLNHQTPICQNHHEAVFDKNTSVGEFYFWSNSKIKKDLINLFEGKKISLKSDLNNHHVLDKNFIKFKSLKFEFGCAEHKNSNLRSILNGFRIEITHSGYSYYNWKGQTVVTVSEEITFGYGLKNLQNGEPEVYNTLLKKLQNGDIMLSPYSTWTIRLIPIRHANYKELLGFIDCDLRLTGTGTFIT